MQPYAHRDTRPGQPLGNGPTHLPHAKHDVQWHVGHVADAKTVNVPARSRPGARTGTRSIPISQLLSSAAIAATPPSTGATTAATTPAVTGIS